MKEDMKIIEQNIDYNSLIFGNGNADLSEKIRNALEHLLQAYKEDESIIHEMAKELNSGVLKKEDWCNLKNCIGDSTCLKCLKEYFRNKVKGEKE